MKKSGTFLLLGAAAVGAFLLWRRANDPARIAAQGDAALTQAAALQKAGQPVPDAMKQAILRAHGGGPAPQRMMGGKGVDPTTGRPNQFGVAP